MADLEMFDIVRIRSTPETVTAGYADIEGVLYGVTSVSVTLVDVVGMPEDDTALNVGFGDLITTAWFQPSFVEFVRRPETTISIGGVQLSRPDGGGGWQASRRPWWRFW
jgi:hypothetical protein